jgi:hypothetical protein
MYIQSYLYILTRSRKCKEIDISIDVIVPLYFIYSQQNTEGTR